MADIGEPLPTGKIVLVFSNTKYGEMECELWCKESYALCQNLILSFPNTLEADTVIPKICASFPLPINGIQSSAGVSVNRRGLLVYDFESTSLIITLGPVHSTSASWIVIGRIVGSGFHNLFRFDEVLVDAQNHPVYPITIARIIVVDSPYGIEKIQRANNVSEALKIDKRHEIITNTHLLSFQDELVADSGDDFKMKSCHDVLDDPHLSKLPVTVPESPIEQVTPPEALIIPEVAVPSASVEPPHDTIVNAVAPTIEKTEPSEKKVSLLESSLKSYLRANPRAAPSKKRRTDVDSLSAMNEFCAKMRQCSNNPEADATSELKGKCRLHGLIKCGSCAIVQDGAETPVDIGGWLGHILNNQQ